MHERVTFRIPRQQLNEVEQLVEAGVYPNRSEAIRQAVRDLTNDTEIDTEQPTPNPSNN